MKKMYFFIAFIGMISLQSCSNDTSSAPAVDNDTISEVFEYAHVNFLPNSYSAILTYPHAIYNSDMVLLYRLSGNFQGEDIWKLQPETYFFNDGTLDFEYNFDFTKYDVNVYMDGFDLPSVLPQYRLDQVFRVVVIPAYFGKSSNTIDFNDYNALVKAYHINKVQKVK